MTTEISHQRGVPQAKQRLRASFDRSGVAAGRAVGEPSQREQQRELRDGQRGGVVEPRFAERLLVDVGDQQLGGVTRTSLVMT